jgi:hypothetical protein
MSVAEGRTYASVVLTKRSKQKLVNNTIELMLSWGFDYDDLHTALNKHRREAAPKPPAPNTEQRVKVRVTELDRTPIKVQVKVEEWEGQKVVPRKVLA